MKRRRRLRGALVALAIVVVVLAVAASQFQSLARFAVTSAASRFAHVNLTFASSHFTLHGADLRGVRMTSGKGAPIGTIARVQVAYDLSALLSGKRLYGLRALTVERPHITIVRYRNGTFNVPIPKLPARKAAKGAPLIAKLRLVDGSVTVDDRSPNGAPSGHLFVEQANASADIDTQARSQYVASLDYGELRNTLYPIRGHGVIDRPKGIDDQRWRAPYVPIAGALDFAMNAAAMRVTSGALHDVDARVFGVPQRNGIRGHLAATAVLEATNVAIAGLAKPVSGVHGRIDVSEQGLLTQRLVASVAGVPVILSGGIIDPFHPRVRMTARGSADLAQLRTIVPQAARLPVSGLVSFAVLAEGNARQPLTWISIRSPRIDYHATIVTGTRGLVAFNGREADVVDFVSHYGSIALDARGHAGLRAGPGAIAMLVGVHVPPGAAPYENAVLPHMNLQGFAVATARNPRAIDLRGVLAGTSPSQSLHGTFAVASNGVGTIGPIYAGTGRGTLLAQLAIDHPRGAMRGFIDANDYPSSFGTVTASGILRLPFGSDPDRARGGKAAFAAILSGGNVRGQSVNGNASATYAHGTLQIADATARLGRSFFDAVGSVQNVSLPFGRPRVAQSEPSYDLTADFHTSDVSALLATVQPKAARIAQGSVDANVHVGGSGTSPHLNGTIRAPEGSVNGLAFRNMHATIAGDTHAVTLSGGHVTVGSTAIAFSGSGSPGSTAANVAVSAPHANLADFNDFFDAGDTFAGRGHLSIAASASGTRLTGLSGNAAFTNARFRRISLGNVAGDVRDAGAEMAAHLAFGGPTGTVRVAATMPADVSLTSTAFGLTRGHLPPVDMTLAARNMDLATWLPMLGYNVPVIGRLDVNAAVSGSYPDLNAHVRAAIGRGIAWKMPVRQFTLAATMTHGRGTIQSLVVRLPSLSTVASGTFGLRAGDPLALVVRSTSPNVGALMHDATGKKYDVSGTLDSTLRLSGTRGHPIVADDLLSRNLRFGKLTLPRVAGTVDVLPTRVALRNGEADLQRGRVLLSGRVPIRLHGRTPGIGRNGPISASLTADDVTLSNLLALLPKNTHASGRIDGRVDLAGTIGKPSLRGHLALEDGTFIGPMERAPLTGIRGTLAFAGTTVALQDAHAYVGGGSFAANGSVKLATLRDPGAASLALTMRAENAHVDMPLYFTGNLNGTVNVARAAGGPIRIGGDAIVRSARIPTTAILGAKGGKKPLQLPQIAFDRVRISVGRDVRVQGSNIDVGFMGNLVLNGMLSKPVLAGRFSSTGGTLDFYHTFSLQHARIAFSPTSGVIPYVNAVATTFISDPATAIRLHVTGPATNMNLALASDPSYDREQILGLLVGANRFGAVRGVPAGHPTGGFSLGDATQNVALGEVNTLFTRTMLEPLSSSLGSALGFSDLSITNNLQSGLGLHAVKAFGKDVSAVFGESLGYPHTQSVALEAHPDVANSLLLRMYSSQGPTLFALQQPQTVGEGAMNVNPMTALTDVGGTSGVDFAYLRKFPW